MPKMLRPQDAAIMREALEYQAEPLDAETFALMLSNNISNPLSEEHRAFIVVSLKRLISFYDEMLKTEKRSKFIRDYEKSIRASRICISRLA